MKASLTLVLLFACTSDPHEQPACGDAVLDPGEQCDDGNTANGDGCSATCVIEVPAPVCGNGVVEAGEQCDDRNTFSHDGCSPTCQTEGPECGNGIVEPGEQCDDHNTQSHDGCSSTCQTDTAMFRTITANWAIENVAQAVQPCPSGFDTAAIYSQQIDQFTGHPIGSAVIDLFDCTADTGTTAPVLAGTYQDYIAITSHDGATTYASSTTAHLDLENAGASFNASIYTDGGYFAYTWNLTKASNGSPLTCATAGATGGVESVTTDISDPQNAISDIFDCTDGSGITSVFLAGTYTVSIDAMNTAMQSIGTAAPLTNKAITAPNRVTDLGTVTIPIDGL